MHRVWLALLSLASAGTLCACATGNDETVASNYGSGGGSGDASAQDDAHTDSAGAAGAAGAPSDAGNDSWSFPEGGLCGPTTCTGCCLPDQACAGGLLDNECGHGGWPCVSCAAQGTSCKSGVCEACTPHCSGVSCGASDGCGASCQAGSGCCTPDCSGKLCGQGDGCGGTCQAGSGCCTPDCSGKLCGQGDGCGGTCQPGDGCCTPGCSGAECGDSDGCGGICDGTCPPWESCNSSHVCQCGPNPSYKLVGGVCLPSCGTLLGHLNLPDAQGGCCPNGCQAGTFGGGPGESWDCNYCCSSTVPGQSSCI